MMFFVQLFFLTFISLCAAFPEGARHEQYSAHHALEAQKSPRTIHIKSINHCFSSLRLRHQPLIQNRNTKHPMYTTPTHPSLAYPIPLTWQYTTHLARARPRGRLQTNETGLQAAVRGKGADAASKQNTMPPLHEMNKQSTNSFVSSNASVRPGYHKRLNAAQM
jgi:hypothetical protein